MLLHLFLIRVNELPSATTLPDTIIFADDTNLFYYHKNLKFLLKTVNNKLDHFRKCFNASNLSIDSDKKTLFHKLSRKDDIPFRLFLLKVGPDLPGNTQLN